MIDFTVFEKKNNKKKTETIPSNNQHCIEKKKKKNSPGSVFNKTIIPLALVGYEMIIAKSNAHSWNKC